MENLLENNNFYAQELSVEEMEGLNGGGCFGYAAGLLGMVIGAGSPASYVGVLVALENVPSCAKQINSWFS
jgi:hypothetical protein